MDTHFEFYGAFLVLSLVAMFVVGILYLLVRSLIWAYHDAEARGKPGWLVATLVLLLKWPLSLVLWLAFRPPLSIPAPVPVQKKPS